MRVACVDEFKQPQSTYIPVTLFKTKEHKIIIAVACKSECNVYQNI